MLTFHLPDMTCGHCVRTVTQAVQAADATARVQADVPNHQVHVETTLPRAAVVAALAEAGYPPA